MEPQSTFTKIIYLSLYFPLLDKQSTSTPKYISKVIKDRLPGLKIVGHGIFPDRERWRRRSTVVRRSAKRWRWRPESDPRRRVFGVGRCLS